MFTIHKKLACGLMALLALGIAAPLAQGGALPPFGVPNINNPYGGPGVNPYTANMGRFPGINVANPYTNFYGRGGYGGFGYGYPIQIWPYAGIADIVNAQGKYLMSQETSRIIREKAYQEFLHSQKEAILLARWIRDTTPTFTETQRKIARQTLSRIQEAATPAEISSGRALNILRGDIYKNGNKKTDAGKTSLSEEFLLHLNVTVPKGGSLGLLRDNGRIHWPLTLSELAGDKLVRDTETLAQELIAQARTNGRVSGNQLKDLTDKVKQLQELLDDNITKMPARKYLQSQRFIDTFRSALDALETRGLARRYYDFRDWAKGGKTAKELVEYMRTKGLTFAPALEGDEAAYEAIYSALAQYSAAVDPPEHPKTNGQLDQK